MSAARVASPMPGIPYPFWSKDWTSGADRGRFTAPCPKLPGGRAGYRTLACTGRACLRRASPPSSSGPAPLARVCQSTDAAMPPRSAWAEAICKGGDIRVICPISGVTAKGEAGAGISRLGASAANVPSGAAGPDLFPRNTVMGEGDVFRDDGPTPTGYDCASSSAERDWGLRRRSATARAALPAVSPIRAGAGDACWDAVGGESAGKGGVAKGMGRPAPVGVAPTSPEAARGWCAWSSSAAASAALPAASPIKAGGCGAGGGSAASGEVVVGAGGTTGGRGEAETSGKSPGAPLCGVNEKTGGCAPTAWNAGAA